MIKCKLFNYLVHDIKLNEIITEIIVDIQREFVELFACDKPNKLFIRILERHLIKC